MSILRFFGLVLLALGLSMGCGDDDGSTPADAGMDGGGLDGGAPTSIEDLPVEEELSLEGLDGPVEVVRDSRGIPHIYGSTVHDVLLVQGYLMSRDRFGQMEFIRRSVLGTLAEVAGGLDPSLADADCEARFRGYARQGRAIYESLPEDDRTRQVAEAFVAGINLYIDEVLAGEVGPPPGADLLNVIYLSEAFGHWHPSDVFAMARFQSAALSYDAGSDITRTAALAGVQEAFPPPETEPTTDAERWLASRAGLFADFWSAVQARRVYTREGFPNLETDTGSRAFLPPALGGGAAGSPMALPPRSTLEAARRWIERTERHFELVGVGEHVGSNSWVVHGDHTESGAPILSNDPHLSLISPAIWWYVHLNTARMDGELGVDAQGVAFAGLPGVVLGYNQDLAWSATTTGYDVTDVYEEIVDPAGGDHGTVLFDGAQVPITRTVESIPVADSPSVDCVIDFVPHHGPIVPGSREADPTRALSVRYTGEEVSNELAFFVELLTATNVDEARVAQDNFRVGGQNFSFVSRDGDIAWSTEARIPQRDPRALTFAIDERGGVTGQSPLFVLPGTGEHEWTTDLEDRYIPHDVNPERGFIATANQDNVGVTDDGIPTNDDFYIGGSFAEGWRMHRVVERLTALVEGGSITVDDMIALQAETRSSLGETLRDSLVAVLARVAEEAATPGTHDDLASYVASLDAAMIASLADAHDRLAAWSLETPHAIGATDGAVIADSVATTLFNAILTRLPALVLGDEVERIGVQPGSGEAGRILEWAFTSPEKLYSFDETFPNPMDDTDGLGDTVLWDDLDTEDVVETRTERTARAAVDALAWLETELGEDVAEWRWGRLHTQRFTSVVPTPGRDRLSIPTPDDPDFPDGFPRAGDYGAPNVGNFSLWDGTWFRVHGRTGGSGGGPSQRLVVEMLPDGPRAYNALPGGQTLDPTDPHHDDEAGYWQRNEQPPIAFREADVVGSAEARIRVQPAE